MIVSNVNEPMVFSASSGVETGLGLPAMTRKISVEERGGTWYVRYPHINSGEILTLMDLRFVRRAIDVTHKQYRREWNIQKRLKEEEEKSGKLTKGSGVKLNKTVKLKSSKFVEASSKE